MKEIPENLDWVKVRSECSAAKVFSQLKLEIKDDISQRNGMRNEGDKYKFDITENGTSFTAFIDGLNLFNSVPDHQAISFFLNGKEIVVRNNAGEMFKITLTLNNEGHCRLKIADKEYTQWQVRKMALEKLFFEIK
jgi:hypothetical protein